MPPLMLAQADSGDLPLDVLRWSLALLPILVLLFLLTVRRWKAPEAGPVGLAVAIAIAMLAFETPLDTVVVAIGKGVWDALPILLVIFAALLLYRIGTAAGAMHALRSGIEQHSRDPVFLVLAFGWVFATFTQGIAGFGAPIAICAPLLVAIGVRPVFAVVIPLIGHAWANFFGTLGVGWLATLQVVDVEDETQTAFLTSLLLLIPIFAAPLAIAWMVGRMRGVRHALPMIAVIGSILGIGQIVFAFVSPELSTFLAGSLGLLALYPLSRWSRYSEDPEFDDLPAMAAEDDEDEKDEDEKDEEGAEADDGESQDEDQEPVMGLGWALFPYAVLTVISVGVLLFDPVEDFLGRFSFGFPFPEATTGFDVVNEAEDVYEPLELLTHPGFFLLLAAAVAWLAYRQRGYFATWSDRADPPPIWSSTASDSLPAATAVVTFLVLASVLSHSGQVDVLALGIAAIAPPVVYAFFANYIGIVGALVTSSSTASNVLFAPLQDSVAGSEELSQSGVLAAQSVGGAVGNVIAPANVVLGTTTAGISGQEGTVLRKTLVWALVVGALTGLASIPMI